MKGRTEFAEDGVQSARETTGSWLGPQALLKFKNSYISWYLDVVQVPQAKATFRKPRIVFSWRAGHA